MYNLSILYKAFSSIISYNPHTSSGRWDSWENHWLSLIVSYPVMEWKSNYKTSGFKSCAVACIRPIGDSNRSCPLRIIQDKLRLQMREIAALQLLTRVFKKNGLEILVQVPASRSTSRKEVLAIQCNNVNSLIRSNKRLYSEIWGVEKRAYKMTCCCISSLAVSRVWKNKLSL